MNKKMLLLGTLSLVIGLLSYPIYAMKVKYVPLEILVANADAVVVGELKITNTDTGEAVLELTKVLKGDKTVKTIKVFINVPQSRWISRKNGKAGIWMLSRKNDKGWYDVSHYHAFKVDTKANRESIVKTVKNQANLKWSKPVKGLSLSVLLINNSGVCWLVIPMKNTSEKSFQVTNFQYAKPLTIKLTGPDGKQNTLDIYKRVDESMLALKKMGRDMPNPTKRNFTEIEPGKVKLPISQRNGQYLGNLSPGKYKVSITYSHGTFDAKGTGLKLEEKLVKNLWKGEITFETEFTVEKIGKTNTGKATPKPVKKETNHAWPNTK